MRPQLLTALVVGALLAAPIAVPPAAAAPATAPSVVRVAGAAGHARLVVDGRTWRVRGVTWGPAQADAATYLPDVAALGANTVRTWGVDGGTRTLLRAAARRDMRVVVGQWLDHGVDWVGDAAARDRLRARVLARVRELRNERGLLMWDLGNEVMLEQHGDPAAVRRQRVAYARFVDSLAVAVHRIDPRHPVTSTEATPDAWRILARHAPHLDLIGVNAYGSIATADAALRGLGKPYLVTETGPAGDWEVPRDATGTPREGTDADRARQVTAAVRAATAHPGRSLGVLLFHYGTELDVPAVRYGLRSGGQRRLAWYALQRAYRGRTTGSAPVITRFAPTAATVPAGGLLTIRAAVKGAARVRFRVLVTARPDDGHAALTRTSATSSGGVLRVRAPATAGVHRFVLVADDGRGDVGMQAVAVRVRPVR